jgi:APA family basic amino acid/polyamine antiporter
MANRKNLGILTASSLVISSMIGTGVFTSLGFQVIDIQTGFSIIFLWFLGGLIAFCGAVSYAELGSVFKRSGGEYSLLRELYHPALGFVAGWISITVGFAAPAALAAMALASYLSSIIPDLPQNHVAAFTILIFSFIHASSVKTGSRVQNATTILKVVLIIVFVAFGFGIAVPQDISLVPQSTSWSEIMSPPFAVALIYVSYAYTGWNSSIYIIDEMKHPVKDLPKSLFIGTLTVMILYISLNYVFLYTVPIETLAGQIEIGFLSGKSIFGEIGGSIIAISISILLLSTVSAYVFLGPRVSRVMGEDMKSLKFLAKTNENDIPVNAFIISGVLSLIFIYSSTFEQVLVYTSFLLILITTITVGGVFVLRRKKSESDSTYRTWGYPLTPMIFIAVSCWTLVFVAIDRPFESLVSLAILLVGLGLYFIAERR